MKRSIWQSPRRAACLALAAAPALGCASVPWPRSTTTVAEARHALRPQDAAVIVAIEDYARLDGIRGARLNGADWEAHFISTLGLARDRVHVLRDEAATAGHIRERVKRAVEQTAAGGRMWFIFIGHGTARESTGPEGKREGLLIAADALPNKTSIEENSVGQRELMDLIDEREHVVLLDACFSGKARDGKAHVVKLGPVWSPIESKPGGVVLTAASDQEAAVLLSKSLRPAFSFLALGALNGWCEGRYHDNSATADDGRVTALEVQRCVAEGIQRVNQARPTPGLYPQEPASERRKAEGFVLSTGVRSGFDFDGMIDDVIAAGPPARVGPWVLMGAGLVLGAIGGTFHILNDQQHQETERLALLAAQEEDNPMAPESSGSTREHNQERRGLDTSFAAAIAGYAAGGALFAAGLSWRLALRGEDRDWIALRPTPGGLVFSGSFW